MCCNLQVGLTASVIANNAFLFLAATTQNVSKKMYCLNPSESSQWPTMPTIPFLLSPQQSVLNFSGHKISIWFQAHADETYKVLKDFLHLTATNTPKVIYWAIWKCSSYRAMTLHVHESRWRHLHSVTSYALLWGRTGKKDCGNSNTCFKWTHTQAGSRLS